jgi:GH43 family beta-xylosidase
MAATGNDPLGAYGPPERVDMRFERYAIDPSILALPDGRLYLLFAAGGLWAAPMSDPQHVSGDAVRIAEGTEPWEHGWRFADGRWAPDVGYWIEAPEPLLHEGRTFIVYSAGHTATRGYFLGLLELRGNDPLAPNAWVKRRDPLFASYDGADGGAYSPGHNGFTTSPDGREDWLVYHARDRRADGTTPGDFGLRTTRAQRFGWRADGTPDFGHPVPSGVPLPRPSGERQVAP